MRKSFLGCAHRAIAVRAFALVLSVLLAVGTFLSAVALGKEVHHRCTGEDCPVCRFMAGAARVVGRSATLAPHPPHISSARLVLSQATQLIGVVLVVLSPVLLGVRLDI
ncbi:MAG: hypothetical protein LKK55_00395 [Olsenella sp.]|jgi:hypothetical protein|nr:hypothetical protein [Olsenella sp.]MCH3956207.1 hypothetical protein [Olsenella sp.]MCI1666671.1 hypothetical protein [Olsenella sp.]MCI2123348.1 hypothetical protein [Olsenella sp.]MCI2126958.1 hypothetical protein [Olsenella sp.]